MSNDEISTEKFLGKAMVHYRHARAKHPYFADGLSYSERTGDDIRDTIRAKYADGLLTLRRRFVREASEIGCIMAECVLDCEIAEVYSALAHGDTANAVEECYDVIAVIMRMIDVLEGRQALGKPVPINEYQAQEWGLEKPVYDGTTNECDYKAGERRDDNE